MTKKITPRIKWFLFLIALLGFVETKAQPCTSPSTVATNGSWRGKDSFNVAERWHIVSATHDNYKLKFYIKNYSSGNFNVDLFTNVCSPLTSLSPTVTVSGDTITLSKSGLTIGSSFLIRLQNAVPPSYMVYNLNIDKLNPWTQISIACNNQVCAPTTTCEFACNGSFECTGVTTNSLAQINNADNWTSANAGSPDLFVTGGQYGFYQAGCNSFGTQAPHSGNNYAGIIVHQNGNGFAEYLETRLNTYMNPGKKYLISMWVSRGDRSQFQVDNLGIWVTNNQIVDNTTILYNQLPANGVCSNVALLNNVGTWQQISFCYTANGTEEYLTIGRVNNTSPTVVIPPNITPCTNTANFPINFNIGYLYIDDVSVRELNVDAGPNVAACGQPSIQTTLQGNVFCNSSLGLTYAWSPATGLSSTTILNPIANVSTNTTYNLTASIVTSDGNTCAVSDNMSIVVGTPPPLSFNYNTLNVCTNLNQSAYLQVGAIPNNFYSSYTWQPGNLSGSSVTVTPNVPTVYTVTAVYGNCSTTGTIAIGTFTNCCTTTVNAWQSPLIGAGTYGDIVINNDLTINGTNAVVTFTGNVLVAPNVKILLNGLTPGQVLFLNGAHVYACADMWDGIKIIGDGRMKSAKGTLIEDALIAISATNTWSYTTPPNVFPVVEVTNTTFNKNFISISLDGYKLAGVGTQYPFVINDNVFTCRNLPFTSTSWPTPALTSLKATCTATATSYGAPYLNSSCANNYAQVNLKAPYTNRPSHIAIKLVNVGSTFNSGTSTGFNGIQIGRPSNDVYFNLFDSHGAYIYATNSNVYSYNNVFQNTLRYIVSSNPRPVYFGGTAIYSEVLSGTNLDGLFNPLLDLNPSGNVSPSIGNRFWNCHIGVNGISTFSLNAKYGTFRGTHLLSGYVGFDPGHNGIQVATNRYGGFTIEQNSFANIKFAINLPGYSGSYNVGSGTLNGIYAGNVSIQNNYIGAALNNTAPLGTNFADQAINISAPTSVSWQNAGSTGLYINANSINRVFNGISLNGVNLIANFVVNNTISQMLDENVLFNPQRGINVLNTTNVSVQTNTLSGTNTSNTRLTLVYSSLNTTPKVFCNVTKDAYQGFEFNSTHTGISTWKGNSMENHQHGMALSGGAALGAQGSSGNPSDNKWLTTTPWTGSNYGTWTADNSTFASSSILWVKNSGNFYPPNNWGNPFPQSYFGGGTINTTTGTYTCGVDGGPPPQMMMTTQSGNSQTMAATANVASPTEVKYIADNNMYRYLNANPSLKTNNSAYNNFYTSKANSNMDKLMQVENSFYNGQITNATALNNAVITGNTTEANYKNFYVLYAKSKTANFSETDSTDLITLANLCPDMNGAAVYQARALYNFIYKTVLNSAYDCNSITSVSRFGNNNEQIDIQNNWSIDMFPNPTSGDVSIISKNAIDNLSITIIDVAGKVVYKNNLQTSNFIGKLDLNLINGIYLVSIKNSNNENITKKMVIAK